MDLGESALPHPVCLYGPLLLHDIVRNRGPYYANALQRDPTPSIIWQPYETSQPTDMPALAMDTQSTETKYQVPVSQTPCTGPTRPAFNSRITSDRLREGCSKPLLRQSTTCASLRKDRSSAFKEIGLDDDTDLE